MTMFAKRTKELMNQKELSQKDLSKMSGVSEPSLSRYLRGEIVPRMDVVVNVAKALGVSQNYLLGGDDNIKTNPFVETRTVVMRNRGQLSNEEKMELLEVLFGKK